MQPSLFIYRRAFVISYNFTEDDVRERVHLMGLPSPDEVIITRGDMYYDEKLKHDFIPYMVYVDWKLPTRGFDDD